MEWLDSARRHIREANMVNVNDLERQVDSDLANALGWVDPSPAAKQLSRAALEAAADLADRIAARGLIGMKEDFAVERKAALDAVDALEKEVENAPPSAMAKSLGIA